MSELRLHRDYATTLDRVGLGLAAGALFGGGLAVLLRLFHGVASPLDLGLVLGLGTLLSAGLITVVGLPIWIIFQRWGYRRLLHAALAGAISGFALFLFGQTYGFGLFPAPLTDGETLLFRWVSAVLTSALLSLVSATIAAVVWRVAYRPR